jgi:CRISPR-associated endoribonuclease Cas6
MQFQIRLACADERPVLPLNYQYELSAWIYRIIQHADADFAAFLHQRGYQTPLHKSFKLFCFSQLDVPKRRIEGDRLHIECREVSFMIGFYVDRAAEEFIRGLFQQQRLRLGDRLSQANFTVQTVEMRPLRLPADPNAPVRVRLRSPLVVARKRSDGQPDEYLHPTDPDFGRLLYTNLIDKYVAATGRPAPVWWDATRFGYRALSAEPKSQLITIKSGTTAQTKVRGWRFEFELEAPRELIETGALAGFGRMNAEGFGFGEVSAG